MRANIIQSIAFSVLILFCLDTNAQNEKWYLNTSFQHCKQKDASHYMAVTAVNEAYHLEMFDLDGKIKMIGASSDGMGEEFEGDFEFYYPNGDLESKGRYLDDHKVGIWERFDKKGSKLAERMYAGYNPVKQAFFYVDEMPLYEDGNENFLKFLKQKLQPLVNESEYADKGATIELGFIVSEKGFIEGIELVKGLDEEWNEKALKELQAMPIWVPGKKSGESVRVWMQLAVNLSR